MTYFPTFTDISDGPCLVVGGGEAALRRLRLLRDQGAKVDVVLTGNSAAVRDALDAEFGCGSVRRVEGGIGALAWPAYVLAFVATEDPDIDQKAARLARSAGTPVNVVDRPDLSTFIVPALVRRGDVVIGISTDGAAPALARRIRGLIEAVLPRRLADLVALARRYRGEVKARVAPKERRAFWDQVFSGTIARHVHAGRIAAAECDFKAALDQGPAPRVGSVTIVGTGPGAADLLTLRALQAMQDADVVLYDNLVGPDILNYVRRDAERVFVGKSRANHFRTQTEIHELMRHHARAGRHVVRLKGGDPHIFGRLGEELDFLQAQNIPVSVGPGITAASACAAAAGLSLTRRDSAQAVTFVTGHGQRGAPAFDWTAAAAGNQTVVIYMGVDRAGVLSPALIASGYDAATPVAVVENGSLDHERVVRGPLYMLERLITDNGISSPALLIIGDVAAGANLDGQHDGERPQELRVA